MYYQIKVSHVHTVLLLYQYIITQQHQGLIFCQKTADYLLTYISIEVLGKKYISTQKFIHRDDFLTLIPIPNFSTLKINKL